MAIDLVRNLERLIDQGSDRFAEEVRIAAAHNAPYETGMLSGSIIKIKNGLADYTVQTNAYGFNGFEYPAHIELGQGVTATKKKALSFYAVPAGKVVVKSTKPSSRSHFMQKTVNSYGGH